MKTWLNPFIVFDDESGIVRIKISEMILLMYNDLMINIHEKCINDLKTVIKSNANQIINTTIIIDTTWEPIDPTPYVEAILSLDIFDESHVYVEQCKSVTRYLNSTTIHTGLVNQFGWYDELLSQSIDFEKIVIDKPCLALARRPCMNRAVFIKMLLDTVGKDKVRASFGLLNRDESYYNKYRSVLFPYKVPMRIEHEDSLRASSVIPSLYTPSTSLMHTCLYNVVMETSLDCLNVSEKTYKAFAWHQIPIFLSSPGHVKLLRDMGFDVFDDLLNDHSYDNEKNIHLRMLKIIKILKTLPTDIDEMNKLKKSIWKRLVFNNNRLREMVEEDRIRFDPQEFLTQLRISNLIN